MKLPRLRTLVFQPPDASDWIVIVMRSLLLIMLASLIIKGWVETGDRSEVAALALLLAWLLNAAAALAHWRGMSFRMPSLIIDVLWVWLWMVAVDGQAVYFLPMLVLITIISGMWYRLVGAFITASLCGAFWLFIHYGVGSTANAQSWITVSSLSFLFLAALLSGYMSEARLYAEHMLARYRQEMFASRYLHEYMAPKQPPQISGWQLGRISRAARLVVGGDFHDFIRFSDKSYAILIGDVSGKGVDAQVKVPSVKSAIKFGLKCNAIANLSDALRIANSMLVDDLSDAFATVAILRLSQDDGCVNVANAGHTPVLVLRSDGAIEHLKASGPPLGASEGAGYSDEKVHLNKGDALIMFTDGVIEARNESGEPYGMERLEALLRQIKDMDAQKLASRILEETLKFGDRATNDDITIIVAKYVHE